MGWSEYFRKMVYLYLRDREGFEAEYSKIDDPIVRRIVDAYTLVVKSEAQAVIRRAKPLISQAPRELLTFVFELLGTGYRMIGEPEMSTYYYNKAIEMAGDAFQRGRLFFHLGFLKYSMGDLWGVSEILRNFKEFAERERSVLPWYSYLASIRALALGEHERALRYAEATEESPSVSRYAMEVKGVALRALGRYEEAAEVLSREAESFLADSNAYAAVPLTKILEIEVFRGERLADPELVRRCAEVSPRGQGLSEKAGVAYLRALLKGSPEAVLRAGSALLKSLQPYEAAAAFLTAAWLAYQSESGAFFRAAKALGDLAWLSRAFEGDALFGKFYSELVLPVASWGGRRLAKGIRAKLLGGLEIEVDGRPVQWQTWRNKKALQALVYLLLSHAHALSAEELARMLWPDEPDPQRRLHRLQTAVSFLRRQLGNPKLIVYDEGFYRLTDAKTDLQELMEELARAGSSPPAVQRVLSKWRQAELLPGWEDDYVGSHRRRLQEALQRAKGS